jgi:tetratricopeptide (TPR) repeat protein
MRLPDRHSRLRRGLRLSLVSLTVLALTGFITAPLERHAWARVAANQVEMNAESLEGALGQGVVLAVLGGFRTLVADLLFIEMYTHWADKDAARVEALIPVVTSIDPRPLFFWRESSRMVVFDIPVWRMRVQEQRLGRKLTPQERRVLTVEQARKGIAILHQALNYRPEDARIFQDIAIVYLTKLGDKEKAAEYYLKAWRCPNGSFYHGRLYAVLMDQSGHPRKAYRFLQEYYNSVPLEHPFARAGVVLERIRELEARLGIPENERFVPEELPPEPRPGEAIL